MSRPTVLHAIDNIGFASSARRFPGFAKPNGRRVWVGPRDAHPFDLRPGDLLCLDDLTGADNVCLAAFDDRGTDALGLLQLSGDHEVAPEAFDNAELVGWIKSQGGNHSGAFSVSRIAPGPDPVILRATGKLTVWAINAAAPEMLIAGDASGGTTVLHRPALRDVPDLPPELGEVREAFTVPRGTARAYEAKRGEIVQIIDVEGQQCSDFAALRTDGLERGQEWMIDSTATRSMVRQAYPMPGLFDKFYDAQMRPMLQVVQDTCGRHDTFGLACTARSYEERGFPGHVNCSDNMSEALDPFGVVRRPAWPAINFFWNTWVDPQSGALLTEESHSRPGDYVAMRVLEDLVCVSTACPDDIDPINGWNPTDVHVRIYRPDTPLRRAVAYREKEDAPMSISQVSAFHDRLAPLTPHFATTRDLWAPVSFPAHGTLGEYWACREKVTLQDMSGLRKFDVIGPDAETLLQRATTRNIAKLAIWRGTYALMCDESGSVIDDGTLFRLAPDLFRWCCGSEESGRALETLASEMGLQVRIQALDNTLPNLSLQGPKSRDVLRKIVFTQPHVPSLDQMKWFGVTIARLDDRMGVPFMLSRSGYTGELGYELFCTRSDAVALWDAVMEAGEEFGIVPMGSAALEVVRTEAGLASAHAEFAPGVDAFEAGLGFAVDLAKADFVGKAALARNVKAPRRQLRGLLLDCNDTPAHGAPVFAGERQIGQVTTAVRSPTLERAIAMARLSVEFAETGTALEVGQMDGRMKRLSATVTDIPFIDPQRKRARA